MTHCINEGRVCQASAYRTGQTHHLKVPFRLCEQKTKPLKCLGECRMAQGISGQHDSSAVTVAGLVAFGMFAVGKVQQT